MSKILFAALIILGTLLTAEPARTEPTEISFDDLSPSAHVTNQYDALGVSFYLSRSPTDLSLPLPTPAAPITWSLGPVSQFGASGNSIIPGPSIDGPYYGLGLAFFPPISNLSIVAVGGATPPTASVQLHGSLRSLPVHVMYRGSINAPPYLSGAVYELRILADSQTTHFDRVHVWGATQFDSLVFDVAARYEVTGSGHISIVLPGYVGSSEFHYRKVVPAELLSYEGIFDFESLQFTENGTSSSGTGEAYLDEYGYLESAALDGPIRWGFSRDGLYFFANGLFCIYGEDNSEDPECIEAKKHLDFDFESNVRALADVDLKLSTSIVSGCKNLTATVTLLDPAPTGGRVVTLSDSLASAWPPTTVTIPAGAVSKTFVIKTVPVPVAESGTINATLDGREAIAQNLTVRPMGLLSLSLSPTTVVGSKSVTGIAKLECNAGPGPVTVDLTSGNPALADPVAASIVVPQGLRSGTFTVTTTPVQSKNYATITGTANGIAKSKQLTVISAASVSPTSLKFGDQVINTTSGSLTATLYNKGAVPYSILGITLTGTNAKYFTQSNDCPANLAAGAVCTIGVRFKPTVTGKKTASLEISTSAKSIPLKVYPSGTGVAP